MIAGYLHSGDVIRDPKSGRHYYIVEMGDKEVARIVWDWPKAPGFSR